MPDYSIENELKEQGFSLICGVDEAGRGPLCGPVVAAACILPDGLIIEGLNDSKKLTPAKREKLFDIIVKSAISYCIAEASVDEINKLNILEADLLAMHRAVDGLNIKADCAIVDGNIARGFSICAKAIIKGDLLSYNIAAASVLAKVYRDRLCDELDKLYPEYGIAKHKGYGTAQHMKALRQFGPSPIHRKQFIRFLDKSTTGE